MKSIIIGTAGHVDHGKTMLIKALTGEDTDRLREEKERGISIELGFAPFQLPSGRIAGVIDVPGHERFIHNMLAGISGIDLVLLVVDASEGVMPQTREHLGILQLLQIKKGIVVITKIDLVEDEWLDLVEEEIKEELKGTFLETAVIHRVSVVKEEGIEELKVLLDKLIEEVPTKKQNAPLRIPVDRIFSVSGFGTVITGTLLSGTISTGEIVEILPHEIEARVRQIQVFETTVETSMAGQRVALNLAGIEKASIERGDVIASPGFFKATKLIDARLNLLSVLKKPMSNLTPVHFYLAAKRLVAKVVLLEKEELSPGDSSLVQCILDKPVVAHSGDHFIIRSYSPMTTIGGGVVLDGQPVRHKRFRQEVIERLRILEEGDPAELILQVLEQQQAVSLQELKVVTKLPEKIIHDQLEKLKQSNRILQLSGSLIIKETMDSWEKTTIEKISQHISNNNLSRGLSRSQLKGFLSPQLSQKDYDSFLTLLQKKEIIQLQGEMVSLYGYEIQPTPEEMKMLAKIEKMLLESGFSPPVKKELMESLKISSGALDSLLAYLQEKKVLVKISEDIYYHIENYKKAVQLLREHLSSAGEAAVSDFRTLLDTSRKYALPLMEHFDQKKLTRRVGDKRVAWKIKEEL